MFMRDWGCAYSSAKTCVKVYICIISSCKEVILILHSVNIKED